MPCKKGAFYLFGFAGNIRLRLLRLCSLCFREKREGSKWPVFNSAIGKRKGKLDAIIVVIGKYRGWTIP